MAEETRLLKVEEAARRLAISRSKLYELLAAGDIQSVHIGRLRRLSTAAIDAYLARLAQEQHSTD